MSPMLLALAMAAIGADAAEPAGPDRASAVSETPAAAPAPAAPRPRESVGSLLAEGAGTPRSAEAAGAGTFFRLLGWVAALGIAAFAAVRLWKRYFPVTVAGTSTGGGLRVVARTHLTAKHAIYAIRVGNSRLLVVGVSGDRIAPLSELDDPAAVVSFDPSFRKALEGAGAPDEAVRGETGNDLDSRLGTYRSEVQRLRDLVRGWRGRLGRQGAAREGDGRPEGAAAGRA